MEIKRKQGRPIKESAEGREQLSTMMQPTLKKWLRKYANDSDCSVADLLENIVTAYKYEKEKNE